MVTDPLDAVPAVPFGHLNSAWEEFKGKLHVEYELWSFSAQWATDWGTKDQRTGYAILNLNANALDEFFITKVGYVPVKCCWFFKSLNFMYYDRTCFTGFISSSSVITGLRVTQLFTNT